MHSTDSESSAIKTSALHVIGLMALATANPLVHHTNNPVYQWSLAFATPLFLAGFVYLIYAVFRREKAKDGWPKSFFLLAWVLSALLNFLPWAEREQLRATPSAPPLATQQDPAEPKPWEIQYADTPAPAQQR